MEKTLEAIEQLFVTSVEENYENRFDLLSAYILDVKTKKDDDAFFGMIYMVAEIYSSDTTRFHERMIFLVKESNERYLSLLAFASYFNDALPAFKRLLSSIEITTINNLIEEIEKADKSCYLVTPDTYVKYIIYAFHGQVSIEFIAGQRLFIEERERLNLIKADYFAFISFVFFNFK